MSPTSPAAPFYPCFARRRRDGADVDIELMRDEAGGLLYETSIATITFFRGDIVGASQALRAQFDKVVRANPWLAGRLVRDKTSKGKLVLRHPVAPTEAHIDAVIASDHAEDVSGELSLGVPYPKLCKALFAKKRVVPAGTALVNRPDAPVAMLRLARASSGAFSLTFSLSHSVGDGRTYYEVLKMLSPGAKAAALDATRRHAFSEDMRDVCTGPRDRLVDAGACSDVRWVRPLFGFGKKAKRVDTRRNAREPPRAARRSSSQPVDDAFFNACDNRVGLMGELPRRVDGVRQGGDDDVFASPSGDRAMLGRVPSRPRGRSRRAPSGAPGPRHGDQLERRGRSRKFPDCEFLLHLLEKHPASIVDCAIPFASRPGELSVLCWTISTDEAGCARRCRWGGCVVGRVVSGFERWRKGAGGEKDDKGGADGAMNERWSELSRGAGRRAKGKGPGRG